MEINIITEQSSVQIRLKGRFDFSTHREFRSAIAGAMAIKGIRKRANRSSWRMRGKAWRRCAISPISRTCSPSSDPHRSHRSIPPPR